MSVRRYFKLFRTSDLQCQSGEDEQMIHTVLCSSIPACMPGVPPPVRYGHTPGRQGDRSEQSRDQPPSVTVTRHEWYLTFDFRARSTRTTRAGLRRIGYTTASSDARARAEQQRSMQVCCLQQRQGAKACPARRRARLGARGSADGDRTAYCVHVNPAARDEPSFHRAYVRTPGIGRIASYDRPTRDSTG